MRGNEQFQSANRRQTSLASPIGGIALRWPIDKCSHRRPNFHCLEDAIPRHAPWANTLPRHFRRGPASHKPFDFLPSFYPFYMFYTAKTFSASRRVHNHYSKRILNLILNRKKFLRRENDALGKQKPRQNCRGKSSALHLLHKFRQLCAETGGLGFVIMHDGVFKQHIQSLDFLNRFVSLWHRHF